MQPSRVEQHPCEEGPIRCMEILAKNVDSVSKTHSCYGTNVKINM